MPETAPEIGHSQDDSTHAYPSFYQSGPRSFFVTQRSELYPCSLGRLPGDEWCFDDAPTDISCEGDASLLEAPLVGLVGSDTPSEHAATAAALTGRAAAERGLVLLTPAERGCPTESAWAALEAGGRVCLVLAAGCRIAQHHVDAALVEAVRERGLLISCEGFGGPQTLRAIGRRKSLFASLLHERRAPLVFASAERLGPEFALAGLMMGLNTPLYAFPGPVDDDCFAGTNELIRTWDVRLMADPSSELRTEARDQLMRREAPAQSHLESLIAEESARGGSSAREDATRGLSR